MVLKTVILQKIYNIEFLDSIFSCITYVELKPLSIAPSVIIWF